MRKSRIRDASINGAVSHSLEDAPWPKWNHISVPGQTNGLRFDSGISPELFPLAKEFSNTLYRLRLELRPRSVQNLHRTVMDYLTMLSRCPDVRRPESISSISKMHLLDYQVVLSRSDENRPVMARANAYTRARAPGVLRSIVRDAWRLGVAVGPSRPDLGQHGLRDVPVEDESQKPIYSNRELKEIIRFLIKRRSVPRGTSIASERTYLANCICLLGVFLPINRFGAFALNNNSMHRGEGDQNFDIIVVLKNRPSQSANRIPELRSKVGDQEVTDVLVKRGKSEVRKIFEENLNHNKEMNCPVDGPLFECKYARLHHGIYARINDHAFCVGMNKLHEEFELIGDDGEPLKIFLSKLRRTLENRLSKDVLMYDKAMVLNHKNSNTTGTFYETITDNDHCKFKGGLEAISIAVSRSDKDAMVWARESGVSPDAMQRLLAGMLKTKVASCSDPIFGEFAPKDGGSCSKTLACFGCKALAVVVTDLYRLASLERRIKLDLGSGVLRGNSKSRFEIILEVIDCEIFPQFERRLVNSAREKALRVLHPIWKRLNLSGEL